MLNPSCGNQIKRMTIPQSPKFATKERSDLKERIDTTVENRSSFKAKSLNKKIFSQMAKLPEVERKELTSFKEFNLSKNQEKENSPQKHEKIEFKARPLDKRIL